MLIATIDVCEESDLLEVKVPLIRGRRKRRGVRVRCLGVSIAHGPNSRAFHLNVIYSCAYINPPPFTFPIDNNIAKVISAWRPSYGDHLLLRQHCGKHHRNQRRPLRSALSTTRHSSNNHTSSAPQSHRSRHHKMYPSSSRHFDEDTSKLHITP